MHVPRMYLACTTHVPGLRLACTSHVPGLYLALGGFAPLFCFLLSAFSFCLLVALGGFARHSALRIPHSALGSPRNSEPRRHRQSAPRRRAPFAFLLLPACSPCATFGYRPRTCQSQALLQNATLLPPLLSPKQKLSLGCKTSSLSLLPPRIPPREPKLSSRNWPRFIRPSRATSLNSIRAIIRKKPPRKANSRWPWPNPPDVTARGKGDYSLVLPGYCRSISLWKVPPAFLHHTACENLGGLSRFFWPSSLDARRSTLASHSFFACLVYFVV